MTRAPLLLIGIGNPSRGDDALGPLLIDQLQGSAGPEVELLCDFQLQVEHALDLQGRQAVLFIDAAWPGQGEAVSLQPLVAAQGPMLLTHALRPEAVLQLAVQLEGGAPPAWLLSVEGRHFELGEGLSEPAARHQAQALALAKQWLLDRAA